MLGIEARVSLLGAGGRVRTAGRLDRGHPPGREPVARPAGRGRDRQDGAADVPGRVGVGVPRRRAAGVESEMELAFAGLASAVRADARPARRASRAAARRARDRVRAVAPAPRRTGSSSGWPSWACCRRRPRSDRCSVVIEDAQWLDHGVGAGPRRSSPVGCWPSRSRSCSPSREPRRRELRRACPSWRSRGLGDGDARALLASAVAGPARRARARPDRRRDARQPARAARAAAGVDRRRSWPAGSGSRAAHAVRAGSRSSYLRRSTRCPTTTQRLLAAGGGRAARRSGPALARGRAARHRAGGRGAAGGGRAARDRRRGCRSAIRWCARPSIARRRRTSGSAVHRALAEATDRGARPGPARLASARGGSGARRGGRRRARALGRPGAGARRDRRRGRVPAARRRADAGPDAACASARWPPRRRTSRPARSTRLAGCWPRRRLGRSTSSQRARIDLLRAQLAFASSRGTEATPLLLAAARRLERAGHLARARDVRGRVLRGAVRGPAQRPRRSARGGAGGSRGAARTGSASPRPPTCCWTRWSPSPTTTTRPFHDAGRRCRGSPATSVSRQGTAALVVAGMRRRPRAVG